MITKEQLQEIEKLAKEFFEKLGAEILSLKITLGEDESILVAAECKEPQVLIGEGGETLLELQHVLRLMARKKIEESSQLYLDINEYQKSKESYLKTLANSVADEVVLLKKEKELPPMPPRDRRIVHVVIQERGDVVSESRGEEPERRVVVKPKASGFLEL
ncbi:MAG: spoIIIJ-associated protein [Parcubacteria group bacterium Greene0714_21]|nr:MAG: spoIIIJ-associated protein [Parcubacteria group bacterium Greene0416_39]TSC98347.1 MAG: spoIIIJ-associated protein [Parcubacteria group bacterium Greene1014_47]TSD03997.1 MAG: spoIIIJ-associated protein [Parcubacteria group bacterium Greene0714_21]